MKFIFLILLSLPIIVNAQDNFRVMFYNMENFFDIYDNPLTADDEYTPNGAKNWNARRFDDKVSKISQVIMAVGKENPVDIIGCCEVENKQVLKDLILQTNLKSVNYKIFHRDCLDRRGIDAGFIYNANTFAILDTNTIRIKFEKSDSTYHTRDIVYVKGLIKHYKDTLHIFINHWPSRYGGHLQTETLRRQAALTLKHSTDSIFACNPLSNIVIMGDFNDYPTDASVIKHLEAQTNFEEPYKENLLYNISYYLQESKKMFSYKFHEEVGFLDQIIVSGALLSQKNKIFTSKDDAHVGNFEFLFNQEGNLFRTYLSYTYNGGFSDHLPVFLDIFLKED